MKTVFITGAAQGIGLATARHFAANGWFVGLYDINLDDLNKLKDSGTFPNACIEYCDVTKRDSIEKAVTHFAQHTENKMDLLVNNAGVLKSGNFEQNEPIEHDRIIDVNIRGFTHLAQISFNYLRQTPDSAMVGLCSVSSIHGLPLLAVYSASKFYVDGLSEALSIEWAKYGIRVASIKAPMVNTQMGNSLRPELMTKFSVDMQPDEVAEAVLLAYEGERTSYILGTSSKVWAWFDKHLPNSMRHRLVQFLTGH